MGTRAIITKNGKPWIATHWDGYPKDLGNALSNAKNDDDIIHAANERTIDAASPEVREKINKERYEHISKKTQTGKGEHYSPEDIAKLDKEGKMLSFGIMEAGDYPVADIKNYGDWAEYQYDIRDDEKIYYRELSGSYPGSLKNAQQFKPLTKIGIDKEKDASKKRIAKYQLKVGKILATYKTQKRKRKVKGSSQASWG